MNESSAKRRAGLWVAIVFVLGLALGGVFGYFYGNRVTAAQRAPQLSEPQRRAARVEQLTKELGLTPAQSQQLDATLQRLHGQYRDLHQQADAQMSEAHKKGRDEIRAILTPDQLPKFDAFLQRLDEQRKRNAAQQPSPSGR
ncbi:MAG TPA: hypothetical protein VE077_09055 [Candidatus Methylomirabilis sp.]|nr:hypothetical protein [Candidatus Methylomirabilis sp.]